MAQAAHKSHPRTPPFLVGNAIAPVVAERTDQFGNLEEQIGDLYRAADLAANLLEDMLKSQRLSPDHFGKERDVSDLVNLPIQFTERVLFAAFEVERRAAALRDFIHDPRNNVPLE